MQKKVCSDMKYFLLAAVILLTGCLECKTDINDYKEGLALCLKQNPPDNTGDYIQYCSREAYSMGTKCK